jgi:hypothetical protein
MRDASEEVRVSRAQLSAGIDACAMTPDVNNKNALANLPDF